MTNSMSIDLTRGRKEYDSKIKNLEGIFSKVENILDISIYKEELQSIKNIVNNNPDLSKNMTFNSMQMDYEAFIYSEYNEKLDNLTKKIENKLIPFYNLYILSSKIDIQLSKINIDNIGEIIQNTKLLIDSLNSLNAHNKEDKKYLVDKAYKTIYSVIMHEEIFERSDILAYINYLNIPINKENIGRLLSLDLKKMEEEYLIDEDLRTIKNEGLGYDYLNPDFIRKLSLKTVGEKNSEYQKRKKQAISEITTKVNNFSNQKNESLSQLSHNNNHIKNLKINKSLLIGKVLSLVLIPIITFNAGKSIGKITSNKITEYKTITRTIDLNSDKIIGDIYEIYDENLTTYVATVLECSPWRLNPTGIGYIRNVTAYEYTVPNTTNQDYHLKIEDFKENAIEKYKYIESKDILEYTDSTTNSTILVTETYQNKEDNQKSTKYIIPFSIVGISIGIVIDVLLVLLKIYDLEKIKRLLEDLNYEIQKDKLNNQEIINRLNKMKEDAIELQNEYNNVVKKYGTLGDNFIIPEINTSSETENIKIKKRI